MNDYIELHLKETDYDRRITIRKNKILAVNTDCTVENGPTLVMINKDLYYPVLESYDEVVGMLKGDIEDVL